MSFTQMAFGPVRDLEDKITIFGYEAVAEQDLPHSTTYNFHMDEDMGHDFQLKIKCDGTIEIYHGDELIKKDFYLSSQMDEMYKKCIFFIKKEMAKIIVMDADNHEFNPPDFIRIKGKKCSIHGHAFSDGFYYDYKVPRFNNCVWEVIIEGTGDVRVWYYDGCNGETLEVWTVNDEKDLNKRIEMAVAYIEERLI